MDQLEQFRQDTRAWLEANCPASQRTPASAEERIWGGRRRSFASEDAKLWFERMRDRGWTVPDWPVEYGGGGLSPQQSKILKEEMRAMGCRPALSDLGIWMLGPALLEYGNEAQKKKYLTEIARGETRWCQGYSEPGAGSDLASLQTRAEDKGDHFLINGSKIWTTMADKADCIFCLVRTDPGAKKQEGISFLLIDMDDPGVSVSPIELISGKSEFCQTFFDNVKVPKENLIGELNKGWSVAKALLKHERKLMSESGSDTGASSLTPLLAAKAYGSAVSGRQREQLIDHEMNMRAMALTHQRSFEEALSKTGTGTLPMLMKYLGTEELKRKEELMLVLMGSQGLGWEASEGEDPGFSEDELRAPRDWAMSKTMTIAGGTSEVQLNIIAKRVLGLPD